MTKLADQQVYLIFILNFPARFQELLVNPFAGFGFEFVSGKYQTFASLGALVLWILAYLVTARYAEVCTELLTDKTLLTLVKKPLNTRKI